MKRVASILLVGVGMSLFFAAGMWIYFNNLITHPTAAFLPDQIAGLSLSTKMTGTQATEEFDMLHKNHFPLTSGAVGVYGDQMAALWVGGTPFNFMAADMVNAMRDKISAGGSPFTPVEEFKSGGRTVYALEGMGQKHFYFQSKNLIIWLAVEPPIADEALKQTLESYP